jgi:electron transfer flavoprotein beta subunit
MNIIVCVKQVPDPETPPKGFKVDSEQKRVIPPLGAAQVINPFCENAVEAALRVKDAYGGQITALTMGPSSAEDVLRHALAMGADEGVLLESPETDGFDSFATAGYLALAIRKIGDFDLVLCGREAADWNAAQVGPGIAEILGLPGVTLAKNLVSEDGVLRVERVIPDGSETVEVSLPALVTVSNELGNPRYPTIKGVMAANKKEITIMKAKDLGGDAGGVDSGGSQLRLVDLFIPVQERKCHVFAAATVEEAAAELTQKIIELRPN